MKLSVEQPKAQLESPEYKAPKVETGHTVGKEITGLLQKGGDYLENARTKGMQYAAGRGLLNSSLGAQHAEKARIDAALPIAQQDAGYKQQQVLQGQQGDIRSQLPKIEGGVESGLLAQGASQGLEHSKLEGNIGSILQQEQAQQARKLAAQQAKAEKQLQAARLAHEKELAQQEMALKAKEIQQRESLQGNQISHEQAMAQAQQTFQADLSEQEAQQKKELEQFVQESLNVRQMADNQLRADIANLEVSTLEKENISKNANEMSREYMAQVGSIQRDPELTASAKIQAIENLNGMYESTLQTMAGVYDVELSFEGG